MSEILSVSLGKRERETLDRLSREMGFSGRSETVRAGIRLLAEETRGRENLKGVVQAVLIVVHREDSEDSLTERKHSFEDIIYTQIHNQLGSGRCLEVFVLRGEASRVRELSNSMSAERGVESAKLVVS
jgi:CopG family nickel-responsive transcriptional regulator